MTITPAHAYIRLADRREIDAILSVEQSAWPPGTRASRDQFIERIEVFPEGFLVAEANKAIVGVLTSQRIDFQPDEIAKGWDDATSSGWIRATHIPAGNSLDIVSVGIKSENQRNGIGTAMVRAAQRLAASLRLKYVVLNSRLPGYRDYQNILPVQDYVYATSPNNEPLDPELRFYARLGFRILSATDIVSQSMANDLESATYGVRLVWFVN